MVIPMKTWKENEALRLLVYVFILFFLIFTIVILTSEKFFPTEKTYPIGIACLDLPPPVIRCS